MKVRLSLTFYIPHGDGRREERQRLTPEFEVQDLADIVDLISAGISYDTSKVGNYYLQIEMKAPFQVKTRAHVHVDQIMVISNKEEA